MRFTSLSIGTLLSIPLRGWVLASILTACTNAVDSADKVEEVGRQDQALWYLRPNFWPFGAVPVCFSLRAEPPRGPYTSAEIDIYDEMVEAINDQLDLYEAVPGAGILFTGRNECPDDQVGSFTGGLRFNLLPYYNTTPAFRQCPSTATGPIWQGCDSPSETGYSSSKEATIYVTAEWRDGVGNPKWNSIVLHEIGHALGFRHEFLNEGHQRGTCSPDGAGTISGTTVTPYDPESILNATYCHFNTWLSELDQVGLASIYPGTTTSHDYGDNTWFDGDNYTHTPLAADFTGDGSTDIVHRGKCGGGATCLRFYRNVGRDFSVGNAGTDVWFGGAGPRNTPFVGDFNGDGNADLGYFGKCGSGNDCWRIHQNTGSNAFVAANYGNGTWFEGNDATNTPVVGDFNGDGRDDIAYRGKCGGDGHECWRVHRNRGNGSFSPSDYGDRIWFEGSDATNTPMAGDFNGDGIDDIAYRGKCGGGGDPCWRVHESRGGGFSVQNYGDDGIDFYGSDVTHRPRAADLNGDGFTDIFSQTDCGAWLGKCVRILLNRQDGQFNVLHPLGAATRFGGTGNRNTPMVGDFSGDGVVGDFAYFGLCGSSDQACWRVHELD